MQPRCAYTHTTPTGNVLEIPALGTSRYNFGSNGVRPLEWGSTIFRAHVGAILRNELLSTT